MKKNHGIIKSDSSLFSSSCRVNMISKNGGATIVWDLTQYCKVASDMFSIMGDISDVCELSVAGCQAQLKCVDLARSVFIVWNLSVAPNFSVENSLEFFFSPSALHRVLENCKSSDSVTVTFMGDNLAVDCSFASGQGPRIHTSRIQLGLIDSNSHFSSDAIEPPEDALVLPADENFHDGASIGNMLEKPSDGMRAKVTITLKKDTLEFSYSSIVKGHAKYVVSHGCNFKQLEDEEIEQVYSTFFLRKFIKYLDNHDISVYFHKKCDFLMLKAEPNRTGENILLVLSSVSHS